MNEGESKLWNVALEEILGGISPPDLSGRILEKMGREQTPQEQTAELMQPARSRTRWAGALAAVILFGFVLFWKPGSSVFPEVKVLVTEGEIRRSTPEGTAAWSLGDRFALAVGDHLRGEGKEGGALSIADLGTLRVSTGSQLEVRSMNWKQFGGGVALGAVGVGVLSGTVAWRSSGEIGETLSGGEILLQGTNHSEVELARLQKENEELIHKQERLEARIRELESASRRKPSSILNQAASPGTGTVEELAQFLEKYQTRVPMSIDQIETELQMLGLGIAIPPEEIPSYRNKVLALMFLHRDQPEKVDMICRLLGYNAALFEDRTFAETVRSNLEAWSVRFPESPEPLIHLARLAQQLKSDVFRQDMQESWLLEATRRSPEDVYAQQGLATLYMSSGRPQLAFQHGEKAIEAYDKTGFGNVIQMNLALSSLAEEIGDPSRARQLLGKAFEILKDSPTIGFGPRYQAEQQLGLLNLKEGKIKEAFENLKNNGEIVRRAASSFDYEFDLSLPQALIDRGAHLHSQENRNALRSYLEEARKSKNSQTFSQAEALLKKAFP